MESSDEDCSSNSVSLSTLEVDLLLRGLNHLEPTAVVLALQTRLRVYASAVDFPPTPQSFTHSVCPSPLVNFLELPPSHASFAEEGYDQLPTVDEDMEVDQPRAEPDPDNDPEPPAGPDANAEQRHRRHAPCRRNGQRLQQDVQWRVARNLVKTSNLTADALVSALAAANFDSHLYNPATWMNSVRNFFGDSADVDGQGGLPSIVMQCNALGTKEVGASFLSMLLCIQLAFKCQR